MNSQNDNKSASDDPDSDSEHDLGIDTSVKSETENKKATDVSCVVGVGASAGGIKALETFFDALDCDSVSGVAFIVVQHLSPDFKSLMDEILGRHTQMPVLNAEHGMSIRANSVYLIPPGKNISVDDGRLVLQVADRDELQRPIDVLFRSLAQSYGNRSVGIVLSGTGSDGSLGVREIFAAQGLTIAQDPATAQFDGMPVNAAATDCVHMVLSPDAIAHLLQTHSLDPTTRPATDQAMNAQSLSGINLVYSLLCERHGINFADYKSSTVARRIERRIRASKSSSMTEYADRLRTDQNEIDLLYHDLLIGVTKFFRDGEAFHSLKVQLDRMVSKLPEGAELRIWSAACATGEEPYTLAMLAVEAFERVGRPVNMKVLATDVHQGALDKAARGQYSSESLEFVSADRQAKFFMPVGNAEYRIHADLRRHIVFARHNVLQDPPFTRIHLVTCRNMLIYLQPKAQSLAIASFHFAMELDGLMMLGASETPGRLVDEFEAIDRNWRIYRKLRNLPSLIGAESDFTHAIAKGPRRLVNILNRDKPEQLSFTGLLEAYDLLLADFVECGLLLDENRNVLHVFGNAYRFLTSTTGRFTGNILRLLDGESRSIIGAALARAKEDTEKQIRMRNVSFPVGDESIDVDVTIRALKHASGSGFVWFLEFTTPEFEKKIVIQDLGEVGGGSDFLAMQSELSYTKESLSATIEELETSNEELQATNEELVASNEELQSTNEELHSVNEELYSVNAENQRKITELHEVTEDVENLLRSTDIGTIFVDPEMNIRKFTKAATQYFALVEHDIGRSLLNFTHSLPIDNLDELIRNVVLTDATYVTELIGAGDEKIILKIVPYKSRTNHSGAILNLIDVDVFKRIASDVTETDRADDSGDK